MTLPTAYIVAELGYHVMQVPTYGCQEIYLVLLTSVESQSQ